MVWMTWWMITSPISKGYGHNRQFYLQRVTRQGLHDHLPALRQRHVHYHPPRPPYPAMLKVEERHRHLDNLAP